TSRVVKPLAVLVDQGSAEPLTFFDLTTALAFATFADAPVDVAVVEVGLGGAEDATNVLQAGVAVLTPIGLDHTEWLGDTLEDIALHKAGIIHSGATVIAAAQEEEAARPILERCAEVGATVAREGAEFGVLRRAVAVGGQVLTLQGLGGVYDEVFLPLHGAHQAQNAAVALAAVEAFLGAGAKRQLDVGAVREGFAATSSPGRLEKVRNAPTVLLDGAHNPHGMAATVTALQEEFAFSKLVGVLAVLGDKDAAGLLELLEPVLDSLVVTSNSSPRAMPAEELAELAREVFGPDRVQVADSMPDAIEAAVAEAEYDVPGELAGVGVLVTGSVVTVADARRLLKR
uniref:bifunctional folylpolyglutamate synthase/dihydrofolate synthase n=1 Tax=Micromonospora sp. TaxID=1876 RepID=UPI003B3AC93D